MYKKPYNLILYLFSLLLLGLGVLFHTNLTIIFIVICFFAWDIGYFLSKDSFYNRNSDNILKQIQNQRAHISYFLPFYGVLFGILFTIGKEQQDAFLGLCVRAGIPLYLLVLPFVLSTIPILFVPTQLTNKDDSEVSSSLKSLFVFGSFFQKISIFLFVHVILRILSSIIDSSQFYKA